MRAMFVPVEPQKPYDVRGRLKGRILMKLPSWGPRVAVAGVVYLICLVGNTGIANIAPPHDDNAHTSSLRATVTMADGTARAITLWGVGCAARMCSRVRAKDIHAESVWLDGLASVREISSDAAGLVTAIFTLRNASERRASIIPLNRVLYVRGRFGLTERLDLARVTKIDFE